jgi:hypothetical protein
MNITVVKNALGALDKLLSQAKAALWDIEKEAFGDWGFGGEGGYDFPHAAMSGFLEELHGILLVILEAAEMAETRASLVNAWRGFRAQGLTHINNNTDLQTCESPALTFLDHLIDGLRWTVSDTLSSEEAWTLSRLEAMLRDTAALVHRREKPPSNEIDVQKIMHDYLSASFPSFTRKPVIAGTLKDFKPDCGIASVGAAIEFKFVRSRAEVAVAFSGIVEDTAGYKGSKDWTRFYSVVYQAEPFALESHFRSDLKRIGAATWTPIVVNGPTGGSKGRTKKARRKKKPV